MGHFLSLLDVVNVSLSTLAVELHSSLTTIQRATSGYLLALALMLPLNGWLVERIGAKSLYRWCFSVFTLCATFLGWSLRSGHSHLSLSSAFVAAFILLCLLHALLFAASLRLPLSIYKTTEVSTAENPMILEMAV